MNFQAFLDFLQEHYCAGLLATLLDENPIHKNEEWHSLAHDLDIRLLWLPKRSPHLNPPDHLRRHGKEAVCVNTLPYSDFRGRGEPDNKSVGI